MSAFLIRVKVSLFVVLEGMGRDVSRETRWRHKKTYVKGRYSQE